MKREYREDLERRLANEEAHARQQCDKIVALTEQNTALKAELNKKQAKAHNALAERVNRLEDALSATRLRLDAVGEVIFNFERRWKAAAELYRAGERGTEHTTWASAETTTWYWAWKLLQQAHRP